MDGQLLAKICVEANLPASYVCKVFGISRMALHTWFRGGPIRTRRMELVKTFISLVNQDMKAGMLPAKNLKEAKEYIEDMLKED
jgi:predicted site-specific integrase-resolvase